MEFINANDLPAAGAMGTDNKVIVQQGDKFVLMTLEEMLKYVASASVETDPTLSLEGVAAEALATGKAVEAARAVNLLDNSDFTKPVNQRGKTAYTSAGYTIDRWHHNASAMKSEVIDGGMRFNNTDTSVRYPAQWFDHGYIKDGAKYTAAFYFVDGSISVQTATAEMGAMTTSNITEHDVQFFIHPATNGDRFGFFVMAGKTVEIAKMAVYEGEYSKETLPEYQPKGYAAELAECMRYFQKFGGVQVPACAHSDVAILITPPCKTKMRAYPTLSGVSLTHLRAGGKNITSFPSHTVAAFGTNPGDPNYTLTFVSAHGVTQFHAGMLYMSGELSADL